MRSVRDYETLRAVDHVSRLLEENFTRSDWLITLGYLPGMEHQTRAGAVCFFKTCFVQAIQRERKRWGVPFRYLYCLRWGGTAAPEFHLVCNSGMETEEDLHRLWGFGPVILRTLGDVDTFPALAQSLYLSGKTGAGPHSMPVKHSTSLGKKCNQRRYQPAHKLRKRYPLV